MAEKTILQLPDGTIKVVDDSLLTAEPPPNSAEIQFPMQIDKRESLIDKGSPKSSA